MKTVADKEIWVVDDDSSMRWVLEKALTKQNLKVVGFDSGDKVLLKLKKTTPNVIVSDIRMPGIQGLSLLKQIRDDFPDLPVIIMTAHSDLDTTVSAYQKGAFEYLSKPFNIDDAIDLILRACETDNISNSMERGGNPQEMIGDSLGIQEVFRAVGRLSNSNITVLVNGETGTGKELVARALHRHSPRSEKPFIALNTTAIPKDLLEAEFFGHEKGAFTGAHANRVGRFEQAAGGTLFLDEIGDMPPELQSKLLRVLSEGEYYRIGASNPIKSNARIIAATHQNLEQRVKNGGFREDLFHRLNVVRINIPPIRERPEDIPLLISHFLNSSAIELETKQKQLHKDALDYLCALNWPGNVREIQNLCRWLTIMTVDKNIYLEDLPETLKEDQEISSKTDWEKNLANWVISELEKSKKPILDKALPIFESILIRAAIKKTNGKKHEAAKLLGWGRNTLTRKIKDLKLKY
jgi:two-component system nitrogen regulation response regulator GlnG